jgi:hypothetical protein
MYGPPKKKDCRSTLRVTIVAFYPADWSPVCGGQMIALQPSRSFTNTTRNCWGISVDGYVPCGFARDDFMGGLRSGVNGTPTFLINGVRMQMRLAADNTAERICAEAAPIEVTIKKLPRIDNGQCCFEFWGLTLQPFLKP